MRHPRHRRPLQAVELARGLGALLAALSLAGCAYVPGTKSPIEQYQQRLAQQKALERAAEEAAAEKPAAEYSVEDRLREGDLARNGGDRERAVLSYAEAYRLEPTDPRPRERIGFIHLTGDPRRSEGIFTELAEENPDSATAQLGIGLARLAQGRAEAARPALERAVDLAEDSAVAHYALSVACEVAGDGGTAFDHAQEAHRLAPRDARVVAHLGVSHMLRGEYEAAEALLRRAVLLAPRTESHHNNLGLTLGLMKRYDEALAAFAAAGTEQSSRNNLGYVYFLNGEYDRAVEQYERALLAEGDDEAAILANLNRALDARDGNATRPPPTPGAASDRIRNGAAVSMAAMALAAPEPVNAVQPATGSDPAAVEGDTEP